jgi:hypothetical protein
MDSVVDDKPSPLAVNLISPGSRVDCTMIWARPLNTLRCQFSGSVFCLNSKEFAVCAGVSYSTVRSWFHLANFPAFRGVIFWQDFVQWRTSQNGFKSSSLPQRNGNFAAASSTLPPRAAQILLEA